MDAPPSPSPAAVSQPAEEAPAAFAALALFGAPVAWALEVVSQHTRDVLWPLWQEKKLRVCVRCGAVLVPETGRCSWFPEHVEAEPYARDREKFALNVDNYQTVVAG